MSDRDRLQRSSDDPLARRSIHFCKSGYSGHRSGKEGRSAGSPWAYGGNVATSATVKAFRDGGGSRVSSSSSSYHGE